MPSVPASEGSSRPDHFREVVLKPGGWLRRLFAFSGPAYLVSVGYMDPGNWATDIEGGSRFGYTLIWVILMSNVMAVLLQTLSARLGIVTGLDLAQGCRREYSRPVGFFLWVLAEIAIAACDLAEVLGTIIGLNLLFGLPLLWGAAITVFDTFLFLAIQRLGVRKMEAFIIMLVGTIGVCFLIEVFLAKPDWGGIAAGFVPRPLDGGALYVAIGIIGATVMPHNLYLHSSLVQSRAISNTRAGKAEACMFNLIDSAVALNAAFFVNAAILIMSAANFNRRGLEVTEIQQAHKLLEPILGTQLAPLAFAVALLAAGQSSTLTGTIAGQIVMEGFLNLRMRPWLRRLLTRSLALVPAVVTIIIAGDKGLYKLLILSQVILSLQLSFAVIPLIHFTSDRKKMGSFVNPRWVKIAAWIVAAIIVSLNMKLVAETLTENIAGAPASLWLLVGAFLAVILAVLAYITAAPLFREGREWAGAAATAGRAVAERVRPLEISHIGVGLEHADGDAEVVSAALSMARSHRARLTLIHIVDSPGVAVYGQESQSLHGTEDKAYLEELAREIEAHNLKVEILLRYGTPADEMVKAVAETDIDLLVLGSHGHRGIADLIYGRTVTSLRHAVELPMLIVRTQGHEKAQRSL
ncbi:MAG: Nramp family divalent metal transporter [Nitrospinota bacterium]